MNASRSRNGEDQPDRRHAEPLGFNSDDGIAIPIGEYNRGDQPTHERRPGVEDFHVTTQTRRNLDYNGQPAARLKAYQTRTQRITPHPTLS